MEIKNLEQALKLQQEYTARLMQGVDVVRTGKMPAMASLLKEKEQQIARAKAQVDATIKERDAAAGRWNERVNQCKASLSQLEVELSSLKEQLAVQKKPTKDTAPVRKVKGTRVKKP
jgi:chromosome segregation ATPase